MSFSAFATLIGVGEEQLRQRLPTWSPARVIFGCFAATLVWPALRLENHLTPRMRSKCGHSPLTWPNSVNTRAPLGVSTVVPKLAPAPSVNRPLPRYIRMSVMVLLLLVSTRMRMWVLDPSR